MGGEAQGFPGGGGFWRLLLRNTGVQAAGQTVGLVVSLATAYVLSRRLGVEGFGQFNYVFAFFYFFLGLGDFGTGMVIVREASRERERAGGIIGGLFLFRLVQAGAVLLLAWGVILGMGFPAETRNALVLYGWILPLTALQLPALIFQVVVRLEYPAVVGIATRVGGFLLMLLALRLGSGIAGLIGALLLAETASAVALVGLSRKFVRPVWKPDPELWRRVLRSSIPLGAMGFLVALINRVDFIMLERMTGGRELGLYSAAYKVTSLFESLPLMIMGTVYPLLSRYAAEDPAALAALYRRSLRLLAGLALPVAGGIILLAPWILRRLFGEEFGAAADGLRLLALATACIYAGIVPANLLISLGRERVNLYILTAGAVVNIGLNLALIPRFGMTGAAFATAAAYAMILAANLGMARRLLRTHLVEEPSRNKSE